MELNSVICNRRSIRKYKKDQIDKNIIINILNNAILSPSAHNNQPWHYYVFTLDKKDELMKLIRDYITNNANDLTFYQKIMRKCYEFVNNAPVLILAYIDSEHSEMQDIISIGASIEHILLSAEDNDLGSLWLGVITDFEEIINKKFNITNKKLVSGIVLGYKDEYPDKIPRKEFNDVVTFM